MEDVSVNKDPTPVGFNIQFRRYFTSKLGNRFDAHDYGYECWPIGKSGKR